MRKEILGKLLVLGVLGLTLGTSAVAAYRFNAPPTPEFVAASDGAEIPSPGPDLQPMSFVSANPKTIVSESSVSEPPKKEEKQGEPILLSDPGLAAPLSSSLVLEKNDHEDEKLENRSKERKFKNEREHESDRGDDKDDFED